MPAVTGEIGEDDDAFMGETHTQTFAGETNTVEMDDERTGVSQAGQLKPPGKVDTSYSVARSGAREVFEGKTPPPPAGGAIGRLKPAMPRTTTGNVPTAAPSAKTVVADAPRPPPIPPSKPRTVPGMPVVQQPPESQWGAADDFQTNPSLQQPMGAATQPMAPSYPTAAPQATTLMSSSPPPPAQAFQPPQAYPVMQPSPAPHQMPTMAIEPPAMQQMPPPPMQQAYPQQMPSAPASVPPPPEPVYRPPPVVLDVTPRSLGIATVAGFCEELIRRNSRLPTEMVKRFTTVRDLQNAVRIVVCQGESRRLDNNTVIGDLRLEGIPPRARGETSIEVTFALDASGILQVSARDAQTGREQRARLDLVGGVAEQDVDAARERMQQLRR
jgi:hypothetical protein